MVKDERYIVYGVTQDGEPCSTPFVLAYARTLDEAQTLAREFEPQRDFFVVIYDREAGDYIG